jgi:hypothetical protein
MTKIDDDRRQSAAAVSDSFHPTCGGNMSRYALALILIATGLAPLAAALDQSYYCFIKSLYPAAKINGFRAEGIPAGR